MTEEAEEDDVDEDEEEDPLGDDAADILNNDLPTKQINHGSTEALFTHQRFQSTLDRIPTVCTTISLNYLLYHHFIMLLLLIN